MEAASVEDLVIDKTKLSSDQAEVYLLQFLASAEHAVLMLSTEDLKPAQAAFEAVLLSLVTSGSPKPGRPIRHLIARCIIALHKRSENRSLADFVQEILRVASTEGGKGKEVERECRVACWYVLGEVMKELGANNMSFMVDICAASIRLLRASAQPVILRYQALVAMQKALLSAGKAVPEPVGRDLLKQLRNGLSDKALCIQRGCAETLITLNQTTTYISGLSEIEALVNQAIKSLEGADTGARGSLAKLVAHFLAETQREGSAPVAPKKKSTKKEGDDDDDDEGKLPPPTTDGPRTLLSLSDMFKLLSTPFNRPSTTRRTRNALVQVYASLFAALGSDYVEAHYAEIIQHLMGDIVSHPRNAANVTRHDVLLLRRYVRVLLRDLIGIRLLSEQGQIGAIRELTQTYLKKWPALMPGQVPPSHLILVPVLNEISGLLDQLGQAPPTVQEVLLDPLLRLVTHPAQAVRVSAAWCLRCFCRTTPSRLDSTITVVLSELTKDIATLGTPVAPTDLGSRMMGRALALSALVAVIPGRPLYVSYEVPANILDVAISLLKRSGEQEVGIAAIQIGVAWTLIGSLMTLGPSFVKLHLPQLLVLWRNALPKPTSKDTSPGARGEGEWRFLLDVREATLSSILSFLRHNLGPLVNLDVARRLVALLSNTLTFTTAFSAQFAERLGDQQVPSSMSGAVASPGLTLLERESMLRRRVFQCFSALGQSPATEVLQSTLVAAAVASFADADSYAGSTTQAAIAASAGNFTTVWSATDGYAFGVTSLVRGDEFPSDGDGPEDGRATNGLNRDAVEVEITALLASPVLGSLDFDPLNLCVAPAGEAADLTLEQPLPQAAPPATGVTDAAIELFALTFPSQDPDSQTRTIADITAHIRSAKLERNPGRKMATTINSVEALRRALRKAMTSGRIAREAIGSASVSAAIKDVLQDAVLDPDLTLRTAGSEALGRLGSVGSTAFLNAQIQWLIDQIVNNRNPESRAGCAQTFGAIYSYVGSLIGSPVLKTMVNILVSLANDPHPVVHFWAADSLARVIAAASLSYSPFVSSTLGQLVAIYNAETHEPEGGSVGSANIRGDLPAYQGLCKIISALVGVLGPELAEAGLVRALVFIVVGELALEEDEGISVEAIKCQQQFLMFAPGQVDIPRLVSAFQRNLASTRRPLKVASINAFYQLIQRDAPLMSKLGGNQLVEQLFGLLDDDSSIEGVRNVIANWAKQTSAVSPLGWVDLCQRIMNRTTASQVVATGGGANQARTQDDEGQSIVAGGETKSGSGRLTTRWRTQLFALRCLHYVIMAVLGAKRPEHFDLPLARRMGLNPKAMLVSRVGDLIRMAFSASTAQVTEIRLQGLVVLRDVIEHFRMSPDPDFEGSLLLEQHQAPIAAALTPALGADSTPEVLASAVQICAVFVGSGVVKSVDRMGRILKLLTTALDSCKDADMDAVGDLRNLSTNAVIMLKVSILTAWAQLQSASVHQSYLRDVVGPQRPALIQFWITSLRDYARVRTDQETSAGSSSMGGSSDPMASGLGKEVLLPYYEIAWAPILEAVGTVMEGGNPLVVAAMDGIEIVAGVAVPEPALRRSEPTTFFWVLYGLAFEAALASAGDLSSYHPESGTASAIVALSVLAQLVDRRFSGNAVLDGPIFGELLTLLYRLAMIGPPSAQAYCARIVASLVKSHADDLSKVTPGAEGFTSEGEQMTPVLRCLAVVAFITRKAIPSTAEPSASTTGLPASIALIKQAFTSYIEIVDVLPAGQKEDQLAVASFLFAELLRDETAEVDLAGPCLPLLKAICDRAYAARQPGSHTYARVLHGLLSACILHVDEMRGRSGPAVVLKVKNNMFALTLLLTTLPADAPVSKIVVERTCALIGEKLAQADEIGIVSVQCAKTLLAASARGAPALRYAVGQLLPSFVLFIASVAELADEVDKDESKLNALDDVVKSFTAFALGLPEEEQKTRAYAVLLPTLILLLDPKASSPSPIHERIVGHLLGLAPQCPAAFRDATATLSSEARTILETSIRQSIVRQQASSTAEVRKTAPAIALKTFGA